VARAAAAGGHHAGEGTRIHTLHRRVLPIGCQSHNADKTRKWLLLNLRRRRALSSFVFDQPHLLRVQCSLTSDEKSGRLASLQNQARGFVDYQYRVAWRCTTADIPSINYQPILRRIQDWSWRRTLAVVNIDSSLLNNYHV